MNHFLRDSLPAIPCAHVEVHDGCLGGVQSVKDSLRRLGALLAETPARAKSMRLPRPFGHLTCRNLVWLPPAGDRAVIKGASLTVAAGTSIGVFGPTGAGKTTLVRLIVGLLKPSSGSVRLDGAEVSGWDQDELSRYFGYLPQDVGLVAGTVADNIGRFGQFDENAIVDAAQRAGAHAMILALEQGYDTVIAGAAIPFPAGSVNSSDWHVPSSDRHRWSL